MHRNNDEMLDILLRSLIAENNAAITALNMGHWCNELEKFTGVSRLKSDPAAAQAFTDCFRAIGHIQFCING